MNAILLLELHVDRDEAICKALLAGQTLREAGAMFGITHERARQIWKREHPTRPLPRRAELRKRPTVCSVCARKRRKTEAGICGSCQADKNARTITCIVCGGTRVIRKGPVASAREKGFYCGKKCQGIDLARNHGFGPHPEHASYGQRKKSHCKRGHPLEDPNLYHSVVHGVPTRQCKTCKDAWQAARYAKKKALL